MAEHSYDYAEKSIVGVSVKGFLSCACFCADRGVIQNKRQFG